MRYMGDVLTDALNGPMDPSVKAAFLAQAPTFSDARAKDILEVVDASPYGKRQKLVRIGAGAAAGLLVGLALAKLTRTRKRR